MGSRRDTEWRIKPDEFVIRRVEQEYLYNVALLGPIQVAQRRRSGHDFNYQVVASLMELHSERQPDGVTLACTRWRTPIDVYHVTIRSIRETLGDVFTLELAIRTGALNTKISRASQGADY